MKMLGREVLVAFCQKHSDARSWIENWAADAEASVWTHPLHIKNRYASASFLSRNVVIFNVKGNAYRLETVIAYQTGIVVVQRAGRHGDYDLRNRKRKSQ